MGNDTPKEEREYKYQALHNGIYAIEKDILKDLENPDYKSKKYYTYGFINKNICKKYPYLLKDKFDFNLTIKYNFNYKDLPHSYEDKTFEYINPRFSFHFPSNFIFINEDFMDVLRDNTTDKKIKSRLVSKYDIIIGGGCLMFKNPNDTQSKNPFRYIILYRNIKEDEGNEIDFFLYIKDKNKREYSVNYILQNGLWTFFDKIGYSYENEDKYFGDGYIVRSCPKERIESYLTTINMNKPNNILQNNNMNYGQNNININSDNIPPVLNPIDNTKSIQQNIGNNKRIEKYVTTINKNHHLKNNSDSL